MGNLYDDFEKRFTNKSFSMGWIEVENKPQKVLSPARKNLDELQLELEKIEDTIDSISQKKLQLSNLAKFYENFS